MTPTTLVAGTVTEDEQLEIARPQGERIALTLRYPPALPGAGTYPVRVETARLTISVRPSDEGWIARAPQLNAIGYGATPDDALDDLRDAIEQYLEFLRDDEPQLAPAVAHHATYVQLLDAPRAVWFASIDAPTVE